MTVYCPNCGKPNTNEAQSCASCGTQLKQQKKSGASKFKGTMMMNNMGAPPA
ncbi:MAG: zinc-ribbon domain-containing protein, partial [Deltaproteobacteria bacterium]|nr:zinc-ribbon domain-containing protein [Deltaproteobacteria bacterium]